MFFHMGNERTWKQFQSHKAKSYLDLGQESQFNYSSWFRRGKNDGGTQLANQFWGAWARDSIYQIFFRSGFTYGAGYFFVATRCTTPSISTTYEVGRKKIDPGPTLLHESNLKF